MRPMSFTEASRFSTRARGNAADGGGEDVTGANEKKLRNDQ